MTAVTAVRSVCAARAAWGLALIVAPGTVLDAGRGHSDQVSRAVLRILGVRHMAQAIIVALAPTRQVQGAGIVVDVLHASSAAAFAGIDRRQRRFALTETVDASLWAASGWVLRARDGQ
ncbi:MAG TPA: hypothetical protein VGF84_19700 [Micromonosporaceae bacterium]|jgi:hypothetical protein